MFAYIDSSQQGHSLGFRTELLCWISGLYLIGNTMRVLKRVSLFMIPSLCLFFFFFSVDTFPNDYCVHFPSLSHRW